MSTGTAAAGRWAVCGHHHRTVAGMCMPALRQLACAATEISIVEETARRDR